LPPSAIRVIETLTCPCCTGKSEVQARRNEKLAQRNPERIQQQVNDLKALKESGGKLTAIEEQSLEALEKDLKSVKKAREALGDRAPTFGRGPPRQGGRDGGPGDGGVLGKRRRGAEDASSDDSDVADDIKKIPMPRDTPPPIPKEILDEWWAKRRARRNANQEPLMEREGRPGGSENKPEPVVEAKTVYEAKPAVRDLRKEAVSAFVPGVIREKLDKSKGKGGLLEPEELDQLQKEGYFQGPDTDAAAAPREVAVDPAKGPRRVTMEEVEDDS
jgi:hypothetical protein